MVMKAIEQSPPCVLGENPVWFEHANLFLWTDIINGCVYSYSGKTGMVEKVLESDFLIGAFVIDENDDLILLTEKGLIRAVYQNGSFHLDADSLIPVALQPDERFNDAIVDCTGRILAGTKRETNTEGKLLCFTAGKSPRILLQNLGISNGMGFSCDNKHFFHTDTLNSTITQYDYDAKTGTISNPVPVYQRLGSGCPDGMTVDNEDTLWTCCWGAGELVQFTLDGNVLGTIKVPAVQCSSLCFGGNKLGTLFVTSATIGLEKPLPEDGKCYSIETVIQGKLEYKASKEF